MIARGSLIQRSPAAALAVLPQTDEGLRSEHGDWSPQGNPESRLNANNLAGSNGRFGMRFGAPIYLSTC